MPTGDSSPDSNALLAKALLSGSVAALSMASGLLVFPILVVQALYLRFSRRTVWLIVTTTAATWIAYFDWKGPSGSDHLLTALREHPAEALQYVLLYLGAPRIFCLAASQLLMRAVQPYSSHLLVSCSKHYDRVRRHPGFRCLHLLCLQSAMQ